jgi:hypothetical protein
MEEVLKVISIKETCPEVTLTYLISDRGELIIGQLLVVLFHILVWEVCAHEDTCYFPCLWVRELRQAPVRLHSFEILKEAIQCLP